jgi:iduronate 2-sulfatase
MREALDPHLKIAGIALNSERLWGELIKSAFAAAGFYLWWYPRQWPATRPKNAPDLAFHANHEFLSYPPKYDPLREVDEDGKSEMRHGYYAAISYVDAQIGKVIDELDRLVLAKNTIIVLTSDHGLQLGEHTSWGKMTLFENDARSPLIIVAPGVTPSGVKTRSISELIDIYPTLVDLCGLPQPAGLDGLSLKPVLADPTKSVKEAALTQHPRPAI